MFNIKTLSVKKDRWLGFSLEQMIQEFESYDSILCENDPDLQKDRTFLKDCILFRCYITNGWKTAALLAEEGSELAKVCCDNIDDSKEINKILGNSTLHALKVPLELMFKFSLN
jgi:hypothetical protein